MERRIKTAAETAGAGRVLRRFETLLRRQRAELLNLLAAHQTPELEPGGIEYDDPAEVAGELYDHEEALIVKTLMLQRLAEVDAALERIRGGTYGQCEACGKPIERARLEVIPTALRRVTCQERLERGELRQPVPREHPRSRHS